MKLFILRLDMEVRLVIVEEWEERAEAGEVDRGVEISDEVLALEVDDAIGMSSGPSGVVVLVGAVQDRRVLVVNGGFCAVTDGEKR